jgi:hypothetical protein
MTPEDRRKLVEKPFPIVWRHECSCRWAGTLIERDLDAMLEHYQRRRRSTDTETDFQWAAVMETL